MDNNEVVELLTLEEKEDNNKNSKKKNKKKKGKKKVIIGLSFITCMFGIAAFLFYGPWDGFRNFWITSAMTTMSHQYLATALYSQETIEEVLRSNAIIEPEGKTNTSLIKFSKYKKSTVYENKYEEQILDREEGDLYKVIDIQGKSYNGFLVAVYDPSRISIATSKYIGKRGEAITTVAKDNNAIIAMNAGGFYDPDWNSNGAIPHGTVISNGKVVSDYIDANMGGGFIGFDKENKLVLGKYTKQEAINMGIRDAVEFGPFLIINGKSAFVKGNGGWGIAPRTAIGQRKDGIVLMLVINGRLATSLGADMGDLTEIMENYGAVNAANLDGGSSSELVINHKIINTPVAGGKNGLRDMSTFWIVK
ncbi:MAG: phosphodiester glycosidase family protein [Bacilli bacterium]|nr:phosphodiester glycosidase family protein [Bacilli bacterium]